MFDRSISAIIATSSDEDTDLVHVTLSDTL